MAPAATSLADMGRAVHELVHLKQRELHEWEELTYRQGLSPGHDVSFGGVRITIARAQEAERLLVQLARDEAAFRAWFESRSSPPPACAQGTTTRGSV